MTKPWISDARSRNSKRAIALHEALRELADRKRGHTKPWRKRLRSLEIKQKGCADE